MTRWCTLCGQSFTTSESRRRRCDSCRTAHDRLGRKWRVIRAKVLAGGPDCAMGCGRPATEVDHIVPLARGGAPYDFENLRPVCRPCNASKGARTDSPAPPMRWLEL